MSSTHRDYFNRVAASWEAHSLPSDLAPFLHRFGVRAGERILDIGCGTGCLTRLLMEMTGEDGCVVAADLSEHMLWRAKSAIQSPRVSYACTDACCLAFGDNLFDKIICYATFPHIQRPVHALAEMRRVLTYGGKALIFHTCCSRKLNQFHAGLKGVVCHDRLPVADMMQAYVQEAGLHVMTLVENPDLYWVEMMKTGPAPQDFTV